MENYIIYIVETGTILCRNSGPVGSTDLQTPAPGWIALKLCDGGDPISAADNPLHLRAALWARVKSIRDRVIEAGALTAFGIVDTDAVARSNITGATVAAMAAITANQPFEVEWTLRDNTSVELDAAEMIELGTTVMAAVSSVHDRARALRAEINDATTVTELLKIDIVSGWPSCEPTQEIISPTE